MCATSSVEDGSRLTMQVKGTGGGVQGQIGIKKSFSIAEISLKVGHYAHNYVKSPVIV